MAIEEIKKKAHQEVQDSNKLMLLIEALNDIQPDSKKLYARWYKDNPDQTAEAYFCQ